MKFEALTPDLLRRAVEIYLSHAYPSGAPARLQVPAFQGADAASAIAAFEDETGRRAEGRARRYTLRLGNARYPFMKVVVHEHLLAGEFTFAVDTHDDMEVKPSYPDYDAWVGLRAHNRDLKSRIEEAWEAAGIPTAATLRRACLRAGPRGVAPKRRRILVVDDQEDLGEGTAALLRAEGYDVDVATSGADALARIDARPPDLLLLDYEMPGLDGLAVLDAIREGPRTRLLPVLLASGAALDLENLHRADGFLVKPFDLAFLLAFVARLLERASPSAPAGPAL